MERFKTFLAFGFWALVVASVMVGTWGITTLGCSPNYLDTSFMSGEHSLRKMTAEQTGISSTTSGGFFLFSGGFHSSSETKTTVKFAWQMNEDTYILSSLPLERIRVKIDNSVTTPTMSFKLLPKCIPHYEDLVPEDMTERILENCLRYATVTAKDSDWPIQIQLPLNQDSGNQPSENK